jgi:hypothetical protein
MLPDNIKTQAAAIRASLSSRGWTVVEVEVLFEDEWWASEIWRLESNWSPQGACAFLTFVTDPQGRSHDVWAVTATRQRPSRLPFDNGPTMRLLNVWQKELPKFIDELAQFREPPIDT